MSLQSFIRAHHREIIQEFADFARSVMPPHAAMTDAALAEHAEAILNAVELDLDTAQSHAERRNKSRGSGTAHVMRASGRLHADIRIGNGFGREAVLAEFRALRASVLRLYEISGETDIAGVQRFNESVDEALTEAMTRFTLRLDAFRDQFIGILGHDLRTPLAAIMTGAALLSSEEDPDESRRRVSATIFSSARRMQRLIDDLLDLAQARLAGTIPLSRERTDLRHLSEEAVDELKTAHPDAELMVTLAGDLTGRWDADRLSQVLVNLLGNAVQHGDGTPVSLRATSDGEFVTIAVHNGGRPIPADLFPAIFEPFATGSPDSEGHRIGLGLFIVRTIVSAHGGQLAVTSTSAGGTTFTARLPRSE